jgi:hypothetical protein
MYGMENIDTDEFSFWASSAKRMFYLNLLPCHPSAGMGYSEYPPGIEFFMYILLKLNGAYAEWMLPFALNVYAAALFIPFIRNYRKKDIIRCALVAVIIIAAPTLIYFNAYGNIRVNYILAETFAFALASAARAMGPDRETSSYLIGYINAVMAVNTFVLIKQAGRLFAGIAILSFVIILLGDIRTRQIHNKRIAIMMAAFLGFPIITARLWNYKWTSYQTSHSSVDFANYNIKEFFQILFSSIDGGEHRKIMEEFFINIRNLRIDISVVSLSLIQLIIVLLLITTALYLVAAKKGVKYRKAPFIILYVFAPVYMLGLLFSFMYVFVGWTFMGLPTYMNIYNSALVVFTELLILDFTDYISRKWDYSLLLIMIACSHFKAMAGLVTRQEVRDTTEFRLEYDRLAYKYGIDPTNGIKAGTQDNSGNILVIDTSEGERLQVIGLEYIFYPLYNIHYVSIVNSGFALDGTEMTEDEYLDAIKVIDPKYVEEIK